LYERARDIRRTVLGEAHPDYAQSLKNIASLYQDMRQFDAAERNFKLYGVLPSLSIAFLITCHRALDINTKAFGPKHQDVATAMSNLAGCYLMMVSTSMAILFYPPSTDCRF